MNIALESYKIQLIEGVEIKGNNKLVIVSYPPYKDITIDCQLVKLKLHLSKLRKPMTLKHILEPLTNINKLLLMEVVKKLMSYGFLMLVFSSKKVGLVKLIPKSNQFTFYNLFNFPVSVSNFAYIRYDKKYIISEAQGQAALETSSSYVIELIHKTNKNPNLKTFSKHDKCLIGLLFQTGIFYNTQDNDKMDNWSFHETLFYNKSETASLRKLRKFKTSKKKAHKKYLVKSIPLEKMSLNNLYIYKLFLKRQSCRNYSKKSLKFDKLSQLLSLLCINDEGHPVYAYPSSGGIYEQEFYIIINKLIGLAPGLYHYAVNNKTLHCLLQDRAAVDIVYKNFNVSHSFKINKEQVIILIGSNNDLIRRKYGELSLDLTLKSCGCLIEAIYLIAAELNLGVCVLGKNNIHHYRAAFPKVKLQSPIISELVIGEKEGVR